MTDITNLVSQKQQSYKLCGTTQQRPHGGAAYLHSVTEYRHEDWTNWNNVQLQTQTSF